MTRRGKQVDRIVVARKVGFLEMPVGDFIMRTLHNDSVEAFQSVFIDSLAHRILINRVYF